MTRYIALAVILLHLTPAAIAARCRGEAAFAIPACACTVKNRLSVGWSEWRVLSAYYAPSIPAIPAQIDAVADVMSGASECDPALYFMWSKSDVRALRLERFEPALVVKDGSKEVRFYSRWFKRE